MHRPNRRTFAVWISLLVVCVLSGCGAPEPITSGGTNTRPAPSTSPAAAASPAPSTAATQPSPQPSTATQPNAPVPPQNTALTYLWPATVPVGLEIRAAQSSADANGFALNIGGSGGQQPHGAIVGGKASPAGEPPASAGQRAEVTVHGVKGMAYENESGYSVYWEEQGTPYAIIGNLPLDQATAVAEALQPVDLATWQSKLAATPGAGANPPNSQPVGMFYLWPATLPAGLGIRAERAAADSESFVIDVGPAGGSEQAISVVGGKASPAGGERPVTAHQQAEVMVRGVKGMAYDHGRYSVYWEDQGTPYAVIGAETLDQAKAIADGLQEMDRATWQTELAAIK